MGRDATKASVVAVPLLIEGEMILTVTFNDRETDAILRLSEMQDLSPENVVRQAIRLYELSVLGMLFDPPAGCPSPE